MAFLCLPFYNQSHRLYINPCCRVRKNSCIILVTYSTKYSYSTERLRRWNYGFCHCIYRYVDEEDSYENTASSFRVHGSVIRYSHACHLSFRTWRQKHVPRKWLYSPTILRCPVLQYYNTNNHSHGNQNTIQIQGDPHKVCHTLRCYYERHFE